jgi:hypothetical protein
MFPTRAFEVSVVFVRSCNKNMSTNFKLTGIKFCGNSFQCSPVCMGTDGLSDFYSSASGMRTKFKTVEDQYLCHDSL